MPRSKLAGRPPAIRVWARSRSRPVLPEQVSANDLAEAAVSLGGLQPDIKVDRGLEIFVAEHAAHELVVVRLTQDQRCRRVTELMSPDPQARRLFDRIG